MDRCCWRGCKLVESKTNWWQKTTKSALIVYWSFCLFLFSACDSITSSTENVAGSPPPGGQHPPGQQYYSYSDHQSSSSSRRASLLGAAGAAAGPATSSSDPHCQAAAAAAAPEPYRVLMLGSSGVGKTALTAQFMTSEYLNTYEASLGIFYSILFVLFGWRKSTFRRHDQQRRLRQQRRKGLLPGFQSSLATDRFRPIDTLFQWLYWLYISINVYKKAPFFGCINMHRVLMSNQALSFKSIDYLLFQIDLRRHTQTIVVYTAVLTRIFVLFQTKIPSIAPSPFYWTEKSLSWFLSTILEEKYR